MELAGSGRGAEGAVSGEQAGDAAVLAALGVVAAAGNRFAAAAASVADKCATVVGAGAARAGAGWHDAHHPRTTTRGPNACERGEEPAKLTCGIFIRHHGARLKANLNVPSAAGQRSIFRSRCRACNSRLSRRHYATHHQGNRILFSLFGGRHGVIESIRHSKCQSVGKQEQRQE